MNGYVPILAMLAVSSAFILLAVGLNLFIGPKRYSRAKLDRYECGVDPTPLAEGGGRFPVKYYIIAMIYIVFDIEIVFLYPWAVAFKQLGLFGLIEMILFVIACFVAYLYVWRRGGLEWE